MNTFTLRLAATAAFICLVGSIAWVLRASAQPGSGTQEARDEPAASSRSATATLKPAEQDYRDWLTAIAVEATQEMEQALEAELPTRNPNSQWPTATVGPSPTPNRPYLTPLAGGGVFVDVRPTTHDPIVSTKPWWYIEQDVRRIVVVAGAESQYEHPEDIARSLSQGIVIVREETTDLVPDTLSNELFYTPERAGPVRITQADGMLLELTAEDGTTFWFDVATRQFVENK